MLFSIPFFLPVLRFCHFKKVIIGTLINEHCLEHYYLEQLMANLAHQTRQEMLENLHLRSNKNSKTINQTYNIVK